MQKFGKGLIFSRVTCNLCFLGRLAQMARAPARHAGGRWFKSNIAHSHNSVLLNNLQAFSCYKIIQIAFKICLKRPGSVPFVRVLIIRRVGGWLNFENRNGKN